MTEEEYNYGQFDKLNLLKKSIHMYICVVSAETTVYKSPISLMNFDEHYSL